MASNRAISLPAVVAGRGRPLVFLHGYPLNHAMWAEQLGPLSQLGRVVLLDLPGYGSAADLPVPDTIRGFSEAVHRALWEQGLAPAVILGHSFGGYVALQLYRDYPGLFQGLVLADTRSGADPAEARKKRLDLADRLTRPGERLDAEETAKALVAPSAWSSGGPTVNAVRAMVRSARSEAVVSTLRAIAGRPDRSALLPEIRVPTLVVWGEEDRLIPPVQTRRMVEVIPGSVGVGIAATGHLPAMERPAEFNAAVKLFLDRLPNR